jgi:hypothetical protein
MYRLRQLREDASEDRPPRGRRRPEPAPLPGDE